MFNIQKVIQIITAWSAIWGHHREQLDYILPQSNDKWFQGSGLGHEEF